MLQKQPRLAQEKVLQAKRFLVLYTVLYGFVFVWFVLVWFVLVWFCICMVLYLYGFILFLLRPCGGAPAIQQGIADEAILTYYEM